MNFLLTGGAGYIGSHAALCLLDAGHNVHIIDNLSTGDEWLIPKNAEFTRCNIDDEENISSILNSNNFDVLMHFAGFIQVEESVKFPEKYFKNNTENAIKLFKICKKNILNAIRNLQFEGRIHYIDGKLTKSLHKGEQLLIDGCSSEASAKNLADYLKTIKVPKYGIWSMIKNKKPELFIKKFKGIFEKVITVPIDREESSISPKLLHRLAKQNRINADTAENFDQAIKKISSKQKKIICAFGSLYNCGNILNKN